MTAKPSSSHKSDYAEHEQTYSAFLRLVFSSAAAALVTLSLLALFLL